MAEKIITTHQIETAIDAALQNSPEQSITCEAVISLLPADQIEDKAQLTERVERELQSGNLLFYDDETGLYTSRRKVFNDGYFLITPDEYEIDNLMLIPGDRFAPYCENEIFPSEVKFIDRDNGQTVTTKPFSAPVQEIIHFHLMLGSEQIFDYFIAEDQANAVLLENNHHQHKVKINVFDMSNFYQRHNFKSGDNIKVKICDYELGIFEFEYLPADSRPLEEQLEKYQWFNNFEQALMRVIDRFDNYLEIAEQLQWSVFHGGNSLLQGQGMSLDEFFTVNDKFEINFDHQDHTCLMRRTLENDSDNGEQCDCEKHHHHHDNDDDDEYDAYEANLPDGITISKSNLSIAEILKTINSPLTTVEIDAFINDYCYHREYEFSDFFISCFGSDKLSFADDVQEAVFMNYVEERWEYLYENYNRLDDESKAELRSDLLESVRARMEFLAYLNDISAADKLQDNRKFREIAHLALATEKVLHQLNLPGDPPDEESMDQYRENAARISDLIDELSAEIAPEA
ncbi:MAG: hypothetical protein RRY34_06940 [Victivallaceae bacterium]